MPHLLILGNSVIDIRMYVHFGDQIFKIVKISVLQVLNNYSLCAIRSTCMPYNIINFSYVDQLSVAMMYKKLYVDYHEKLLKLPMQDNTFIAKLNTQNLLPGDTGSKIEGETNPSAKASYFLKHIIEPSIGIDEGNSFKRLLSVMEECDYDHIKHLASEIRSKINGNYIFIHIAINICLIP